MDPAALKSAISDGLLSFPLTDFTADLAFDATGYRRRLEWLMPYGATALFAAGGTASSSRSRRANSAGSSRSRRTPARQGPDHRRRRRRARARDRVRARGRGRGRERPAALPHYLTEANQAGSPRTCAACAAR
jgi:5-dehydro-4-deoxyglucarate dehydratase